MKNLFFENSIMMRIVNFIIYRDWWPHNNYFKPGEPVKYNWKARVIIPSVVRKKPDILIVAQLDPAIKQLDSVDFIDGDSADAFWLRKLYPWERDPWVYGVCRGRRARRHCRTKVVEFVLWEAGEQGHQVDCWIRFDESWWDGFVPLSIEEFMKYPK